MAAGKKEGMEWVVWDSYVSFEELASSPITPESGILRLYGKDDGTGVSTLCYKNDAGTEVCFPISGTFVTGGGVVNRLAFWSSASAIDDVPRTLTEGSVLFAHSDFLPQEDNSNFFWNNTDKRLGIKTNAPAMDLHVVGTIRSDFTSGKAYDIARRAGDLRLLSIQSQTSGAPHNIELYTKDGDGTDAMSINMFAKGTPSSVTDRELFQLTYDTSTPHFALVSDAGGTGTVRPLKFYTGANTSQLVLNTDGTITVGSVLDAATGFRIAGGATSGNILRGNGTNFVASAQSGIDHGSLGGLTDDDHTQYRLESVDHTHETTGAEAGKIDHGAALNGLTDDDHTQYGLLAGRSGGQVLVGGTASGDDLTLQSTSNATRGDLITDVADVTMVATSRARMASQNRFRHLNSMASVTPTANQTGLAASAFTTRNYGAETFDTDGVHDNVTNNSRLTAAITGKYLAVGSIRIDGTNITTPVAAVARFIINGGTSVLYGTQVQLISVSSVLMITCAALLTLTATDYVEMQGSYQGGGGTYDMVDNSQDRFALFYVGE